MKDYHVNVFYSEADEGYIADIPDLKYCSGFGKTPVQALREAEEAKKLWTETAQELGRKIPRRRYRPVIYQLT